MPRNFSNTASQAATSASIDATATSVALTSYTGYPAAPYTAVLERGTANEEVVLVTAVTGSTVTMTRGYDGTTAKAHSASSTFMHVVVAQDYRDAQGTPFSTVDTVARRASDGGVNFAYVTASSAPASSAALTRKDYVDGQVALKASLAGATFTGAVTVPTPTASGHAATKAYVDSIGISNTSADYTLAATDAGRQVSFQGGAAQVLTVPTNATVPGFILGVEIEVARQGSGTVTITPAAGVSILSENNDLTIRARYGKVRLVKIATDTWWLDGDVVSGTDATVAAAVDTPSAGRLAKFDQYGNLNGAQVTATQAAPTQAAHLTRKDYVDAVGSRVTTLESDTGWQTIAPAAGNNAGSGSAYRVKGGMVELRLNVAFTGQGLAGFTLFTLPAAARPTGRPAFIPLEYYGGQVATLSIDPSGACKLEQASSGSPGGVVGSGCWMAG